MNHKINKKLILILIDKDIKKIKISLKYFVKKKLKNLLNGSLFEGEKLKK